jgi:tRNA threonylcarbamoyladenosine biosynthesis protein TsaE
MKVENMEQMIEFGFKLGRKLRGGETIELIGDIGAGKTTLVKGIARGLSIDEEVASPSFTVSRTYAARDGLFLQHYDFYRLDEAGIMESEIAETLRDPKSITVIEWAGGLSEILPKDRQTIKIEYLPEEEAREVVIGSA